MEIHHYASEQEVNANVTQFINEVLRSHQNSPLLFLMCGGSALKLVPTFDTEMFSKYSTISVTDERYSNDPAVNNFAQLMELGDFGAKTRMNSVSYINTHVRENESLEELATRFNGALHAWREQNPNGKVVAVMGMGPDGHTCGMMPYPEDEELFGVLFEQPNVWGRGYNAKDKNEFSLRVTVTMPFLINEVDTSIVYAVGQNKSEAFKRLTEEDGRLAETPVRVLREMKEVHFFTDIG